MTAYSVPYLKYRSDLSAQNIAGQIPKIASARCSLAAQPELIHYLIQESNENSGPGADQHIRPSRSVSEATGRAPRREPE